MRTSQILRLTVASIATASALVLTACGGGGGSGGTSELQYSISLTTHKTLLPLNINPAQNTVGIGAYAPYSTTLYVAAQTGGLAIPDKEEAFSCTVNPGLDQGALYYLDGKDEHEETDEATGEIKQTAYRSIVLESNSGRSSFHFHASNAAGTAEIVCSVVDPRDGKVYSSSVHITVGAQTGKPAWILESAQALGPLGTINNQDAIPTSVAIQARVFDDANQPVPNPINRNLRVSIHKSSSAMGAKLISNLQSGNAIELSTVEGVGQFSLQSGTKPGEVVLELTADRFDNDITNGIQEPISALLPIVVHDARVADPLVIGTIFSAKIVEEFVAVLFAKGGTEPYAWTIQHGELPVGLSLNHGVIAGIPKVDSSAAGNYPLVIKVTDAKGKTALGNFTLTLVR